MEEDRQVNDNVSHTAGSIDGAAHIMRTCDVSQMVCAFGDATGTGRAHLDYPKECAEGRRNQMSCAEALRNQIIGNQSGPTQANN